MKYLIFILCLFIYPAYSIEIDNIQYYATNNSADPNKALSVYILKDDPCITVSSAQYGLKRYCDINGDDFYLNGPSPTFQAHYLKMVDDLTISFKAGGVWFYFNCFIYVDKGDYDCTIIEPPPRLSPEEIEAEAGLLPSEDE